MNTKFFIYSGFIMGGLILLIGFVFLVRPPEHFTFVPPVLMGAILVFYGGFRVYRSYLMWKRNQPPHANDE
jgi:uncharacterized membrane protein HdeD (DUF308 family)